MTSSAIFVGIRGGVSALDRETGRQLWKTKLKGADFVNVTLDDDRVFAATKGEMFAWTPPPARFCGSTNFPARVVPDYDCHCFGLIRFRSTRKGGT